MGLRLVGGWNDNPEPLGSRETPGEIDASHEIVACAVALVRAVILSGLMGSNVPQVGGFDAVAPPAVALVSMDEAIARWKDRLTARCRPASVRKMTGTVRVFAERAGWRNSSDVTLVSAEATLCACRRGDGGAKWAACTHDHAIKILHVFGDFLRRSKILPFDPLEDLEGMGSKSGSGARPITEADARRLIAESIKRYRWAGQLARCAPLYWLTMFHTGLRYSEAGAMTWGAITEDADGPTLITDPDWPGNKSGDQDEIPIRRDLYALLTAWKAIVPHEATDPVFPCPPAAKTWHLDRAAAKIPKVDARHGKCTSQTCRKSFSTWLDAQKIPRSLVTYLLRQAGTLAESRYIRNEVVDPRGARDAVEALPPLWPVGGDSFSTDSTKELDKREALVDTADATLNKPMCIAISQLDQVDGPVSTLGSTLQSDRVGPGPSTRPSFTPAEPRSAPAKTGSAGNRSFLNSLDTEVGVADALARWLSDRVSARGSQGAPDATPPPPPPSPS